MSEPKKSIERNDTGLEKNNSNEAQVQLTVHQPRPMSDLLDVLGSMERVKERISDDKSGDLGGSGGMVTSGKSSGSGVSIRDNAIASLPSETIMRSKLKQKLKKEMKGLERKAFNASKSSKKGSAHTLNELYARIRKVQNLISELIDATFDLVKRLYIKMFIDHQKVV
ncbi:hypothetical protein HOF56_05160 [Candidatus Peribacteria bacterium]|jgi:hypothetical protein|nr:hypothetical protein [Candidatus Peribacteria bacterium]MBT4021628.1 hypothetical protein [Candidatus Peribacteria bacterium]MBT4240726.1 hypothetical protein [Candidatus Peribacteria bacterium]MBT4474001.1 hypothetical protein [Candidatus Peribacteria bacterium]